MTASSDYFDRSLLQTAVVAATMAKALNWRGAADSKWSYGLVVRTLDSESSNPSSNLGRTFFYFFSLVRTQ